MKVNRTREIDQEDLKNQVVIMIKKEISRIDINEKEVPLFHSIDKKDRERMKQEELKQQEWNENLLSEIMIMRKVP